MSSTATRVRGTSVARANHAYELGPQPRLTPQHPHRDTRACKQTHAHKHASPQAKTCVHRTHTRCGTTVVRVAHMTRVHLWLENLRGKDGEGDTLSQLPPPDVKQPSRTTTQESHTTIEPAHMHTRDARCKHVRGSARDLAHPPTSRATFEQTCISARARVRASVRALRHPTPHKGVHTRHSPGTHVSPRYLRTGSGERAHVRGSVRAPARKTPRSVPSELNRARS